MNVSLTEEIEEPVNTKVESGRYRSASEVVREGLRLMGERDQLAEVRRRPFPRGFVARSRKPRAVSWSTATRALPKPGATGPSGATAVVDTALPPCPTRRQPGRDLHRQP